MNQSISDRKRAEDELKEAKADIDKLEKQLATVRKQLQEETLLRVDLENRIQSLREDVQFKQQVHEKELEEENNTNRDWPMS